jgi:Terminase large subunit, T4likevirus-type, N-terminal
MNILRALDDPKVFAPFFRGDSWSAWRVFLAALFALPLQDGQLALYQRHTGRTAPPAQPSHESWLVCGRRSGKSFVLATVAVFLAAFRDWRPFLGPGERGTIMIIAADRKQARVIMRYIIGLLRSVPMLAQLIESEAQERVDLRNRVVIEVHTASFRSTRGYAIVAGLLDELAFWPTDEGSSEPDVEVISAIRPGMATIPGAMLLCASSPYARRGALYHAWRKHFAKDGDPVLCWRADTRSMNPTVPQRVIDAAMEADPTSAQAEYGAEFRSDIEALLSREAVEACISFEVRERAPMSSVRYYGFVDPSGGSADSMSLAVGHREGDVVVLDALRERKPPFSPEDVVSEFSELLRSYRMTKVCGDRFAGEWPIERFRQHSVVYEPAAKPKSDLYRDILPLINSRKLDLLDDTRLLMQLVGLERRTARGGRDSIDHAPGAHDDLANAVAGLATTAKRGSYPSDLSWVSGPAENAEQDFLRSRFQTHLLRFGGRRW